MKKTHKQKKISFHRIRHAHIRKGLIFGLCFGGLMTIVGLAQLLAAPFIGTSLTPSSQSAGTNQVKTITVVLNSGTQDVNGGFAQVTFDSNRLSFAALERVSGDFRIIQQQVTGNSVAFEYQSTDNGGTDGQFNIANIKFTTRPLSGTQTTHVTGSAGAYEGRSDPEYYPASNLSASITITGSAAPSPSPAPAPAPPSPSPSPAPSPKPSPSPAAPGTTSPTRPGSPANPASPGNAPVSPPNPTDQEESDSNPQPPGGESSLEGENEPSDAVGDTVSTSSDETKKTSSFPIAAVIGVLILVVDGVLYYYYRKHKTGGGADRTHKRQPKLPDDVTVPVPLEAPRLAPPPSPQAEQVSTSPPHAPVIMQPPPPSPAKSVAQPVSRLAIKQTWGDIRKEQTERIAHGGKGLSEDLNLPDMFELAKQHPESFGSQSLYNEESGSQPELPKRTKS